VIVALVMVTLAVPLFDRVKLCAAGAAPPQSAEPKSMGAEGHPEMAPWPMFPENMTFPTLVPHVTPVTVMLALAVADALVMLVGVKSAFAVTLSPGPSASAVGPP
jgi:hypothetical protein